MRQRKAKKKRGLLRGLYRTVVAFSAAVVVLYIAFTMAFRPPDVAQAANDPGVIGEQDPSLTNPNVSDNGARVRKDLCYTFLLAASDDGNGNADTIMLITYDVPNKKIGVVSIPRDTVVSTSRKNSPKINAAYAKGMDVLRAEVSELVGFPIDFTISVDMDAFVELVDAVGGIDFDVPVFMNYYQDKDFSIYYAPGVQHLSGQQALEVARFRKNSDGQGGYADSDIGRTKTQQQMLATLASKIISWNSLTRVTQFVNIFATYVDTNLKLQDMVYFAAEAVKLDLSSGLSTATLPGDGTKKYKGYPWCYVLYQEDSLAILNELVNPYVEDLTLEDVNFIKVN